MGMIKGASTLSELLKEKLKDNDYSTTGMLAGYLNPPAFQSKGEVVLPTRQHGKSWAGAVMTTTAAAAEVGVSAAKMEQAMKEFATAIKAKSSLFPQYHADFEEEINGVWIDELDGPSGPKEAEPVEDPKQSAIEALASNAVWA